MVNNTLSSQFKEHILHPGLHDILQVLRQRRGFDVETCLKAKETLIHQYFKHSVLKAAVIGVSGGVDSAVALALMVRASRSMEQPLKSIVAALLPYFIKTGTSNQQQATERGMEVAKHYGATVAMVDLSTSHETLKAKADQAMGIEGDDWAAGQLVSYLRTPALFYLTSLLTQQDQPAMLIGTTNRDEGGYIGYFGKAADAMVDLQILSDLHKSEVFALARALDVPESVLAAAPTGDIYDGRTDEQLIGVPYDFIELYSLLLSLVDQELRQSLLDRLDSNAMEQYRDWQAKLDQLNKQNAHKYAAGSVAIHLDVYERAVPGGWRQDIDARQLLKASKAGGFVNEIQIDPAILATIKTNTSAYKRTSHIASNTSKSAIAQYGPSAFVVDNLLSAGECQMMLDHLDKLSWTAVGQNGMLKDYQAERDTVGSHRATLYNEQLASYLYTRLTPVLPAVRVMEQHTPADWDGSPVWRAVAVSPLMRFIKYQAGGLLVPHYDAPFDYYDGKRTLMSMVVYLTASTSKNGGATRFIKDPQTVPPVVPLEQRDYSDWQRLSRPDEIIASLYPQPGSAILMDHRVLHDGQELTDGTKIIMRTDIVFERCGLAPHLLPGASKPLGLPDKTQSTSGANC